jgi:hypothetical protein
MLTTSGIRFSGVPPVFFLEFVVTMVLLKKTLQTNRDIDNGPVRNIYIRRDRVWEPRDQFNYNVKCNRSSISQTTSLRGLTAKEVE